jgi:hypothetical protein
MDGTLLQTCGEFWDSGRWWCSGEATVLRYAPKWAPCGCCSGLRTYAVGRIVDSPLYVPPLGRTRSIRLNRRRAQKSRAVLARVSTPASFRCQPICLTAIGSKITAAQPLLCGELTVDRRLHGRQGSSRGCGGPVPGISREGY